MTPRMPTPIGEMWLDDDGLLWHRLNPGVEVTAADAKATLAAMEDLTGGRAAPAVVDIRGVAFANRQARQFFSQDLDASPEIATALIVGSGPSRAMANLFLKLSRPARPVRSFTREEEAAAWARGFLEQAPAK